jgi:hypothetical protein
MNYPAYVLWIQAVAAMFSSLLELQFELIQSLLAMRRYANWRFVRSLAELQILTRASYAMLIIVPLLAGGWPAVRLLVNQHNKAVTEAALIFDRSSDRIAAIEQQLSASLERVQSTSRQAAVLLTFGEQLRSAVDQLRMQVIRYKGDYVPRTIETPVMPRPFAAAFFAALAVVIAHMLYQLFAPDVVRHMTLEQYIHDRKKDHSDHPTLTGVRDAEVLIRRGATQLRLSRRSV